MTFNQYLKVKLGIDPESAELDELMDEHYDEYMEYLKGVKDGCGPEN